MDTWNRVLVSHREACQPAMLRDVVPPDLFHRGRPGVPSSGRPERNLQEVAARELRRRHPRCRARGLTGPPLEDRRAPLPRSGSWSSPRSRPPRPSRTKPASLSIRAIRSTPSSWVPATSSPEPLRSPWPNSPRGPTTLCTSTAASAWARRTCCTRSATSSARSLPASA